MRNKLLCLYLFLTEGLVVFKSLDSITLVLS
jgi:hypothetical protein